MLLKEAPRQAGLLNQLITRRGRATSTRAGKREIDLNDDASTDPLTGLMSRDGLAMRLERLREAARGGIPVTIYALSLDLDLFDLVNDAHGHDAGDEVLRQIGALLLKHFRRGDLSARVGGEEFVVILRDMSLESAAAVAEQLRSRIEKTPVLWKGVSIAVTASIGVAMIANSDDTDQLLRDANLAMYRAKSAGRNRVAEAWQNVNRQHG